MSGGKKRVRLVGANLTGRYDLVPELQWDYQAMTENLLDLPPQQQ